ncbi:MAG: hypothetical protein JSS10_01015 [Verrucomicrobia bacterium]|nr:hypothetical protein [Verrucomicrobiota bacterium]
MVSATEPKSRCRIYSRVRHDLPPQEAPKLLAAKATTTILEAKLAVIFKSIIE